MKELNYARQRGTYAGYPYYSQHMAKASPISGMMFC